MEEVVKAYIAGIIDGEGCIGIEKQGRVSRNFQSYNLRISVGMADRAIILFLKEQCGGNFCASQKAKPNRKARWDWRIWGNKAAELLILLLPYLQVKLPQANLGIEFRANWKDQRGVKGWKQGKGTVRCLPEVAEERKRYYREMRALNSGKILG